MTMTQQSAQVTDLEVAAEEELLTENMEQANQNPQWSPQEHDFLLKAEGDVNSKAGITQTVFENLHARKQPEEFSFRKCLSKNIPTCSGRCLKNVVLSKLPFINIMMNYDLKGWFLNDLIAGISIAVIHIPQGMGFALLTSVPPVYGLYSSLYPAVLYFFFGTSRHISMGTMAVVSLMIGAIVDRETMVSGLFPKMLELSDNSTSALEEHIVLGNMTTSSPLENFKVDIAMSVSLLMGAWQVVLSLFNLGIVAKFMSMTFIVGFLTGCAFHIASSQIPNMFGISIEGYNGHFRLPIIWYQICAGLGGTNLAEVVITLISMTLLIIMKEVVNVKCKDRLRAPIPAELIVVALACLVSYFGNLHELFGVNIVGTIPTGLPKPRMPSMTNATNYIVDSLVIAIVSFAISVSMAKVLARKRGYAIDQNQELLASGMSYGASSFFLCFGGAQAPPRSLVQESSGETQVAGLVSSAIVLLVCLVMGPLFQALPTSVLASIIIVALFPLFKSFMELPNYWHINRCDCLTWVLTWLVTTLVGITAGIVVGVLFSMLTVFIQAYHSHGARLGEGASANTAGVYRNIDEYDGLRIPKKIRIFGFSGELFYANVEDFKIQLYTKCELETKNKSEENLVSKTVKVMENGDLEQGYSVTDDAKNESDDDLVKAIIVDCSAITYIDITGLNLLKEIKSNFFNRNIKFALANCNEELLTKLQCCAYVMSDEENLIFISVKDAVVWFKQEIQCISI